jgi:hypothetical protein
MDEVNKLLRHKKTRDEVLKVFQDRVPPPSPPATPSSSGEELGLWGKLGVEDSPEQERLDFATAILDRRFDPKSTVFWCIDKFDYVSNPNSVLSSVADPSTQHRYEPKVTALPSNWQTSPSKAEIEAGKMGNNNKYSPTRYVPTHSYDYRDIENGQRWQQLSSKGNVRYVGNYLNVKRDKSGLHYDTEKMRAKPGKTTVWRRHADVDNNGNRTTGPWVKMKKIKYFF